MLALLISYKMHHVRKKGATMFRHQLRQMLSDFQESFTDRLSGDLVVVNCPSRSMSLHHLAKCLCAKNRLVLSPCSTTEL